MNKESRDLVLCFFSRDKNLERLGKNKKIGFFNPKEDVLKGNLSGVARDYTWRSEMNFSTER